MAPITEEIAPGQVARVRQRIWPVEEVFKSRRSADSALVRLSCVDDDNQGQPLEVLWEKELDPQVLTGEAWEAVASKEFDDSHLFAGYLNTPKWHCVTSTDPKLFQSPLPRPTREVTGDPEAPHLHDAMDRAVLEAYGWDDPAGTARCEFLLDYEEKNDEPGGKKSKKKKPWRLRWPDDFRDEVLAQLLELNEQRHKEELPAGQGAANEIAGDRKKPKKRTTAKRKPAKGQQKLFG